MTTPYCGPKQRCTHRCVCIPPGVWLPVHNRSVGQGLFLQPILVQGCYFVARMVSSTAVCDCRPPSARNAIVECFMLFRASESVTNRPSGRRPFEGAGSSDEDEVSGFLIASLHPRSSGAEKIHLTRLNDADPHPALKSQGRLSANAQTLVHHGPIMMSSETLQHISWVGALSVASLTLLFPSCPPSHNICFFAALFVGHSTPSPLCNGAGPPLYSTVGMKLSGAWSCSVM